MTFYSSTGSATVRPPVPPVEKLHTIHIKIAQSLRLCIDFPHYLEKSKPITSLACFIQSASMDAHNRMGYASLLFMNDVRTGTCSTCSRLLLGVLRQRDRLVGRC
jgi:hypothetical protein